MCTGRVDLAFVLRAFSRGLDGVIIVGCLPGECHYVVEGNFDALSMTQIAKKMLQHIGVNPERVRLVNLGASDGIQYAEFVNQFSKKVRELGPLGKGEGIEEDTLKFKLEAAQKLVPYIRLVERERLRLPAKSVGAYNAFFSSEEFDRLFKELIADKMEVNEMMTLLREQPRSAGEISQVMRLSPSEVARHINNSARQGLVNFDESQDLIAAAM